MYTYMYLVRMLYLYIKVACNVVSVYVCVYNDLLQYILYYTILHYRYNVMYVRMYVLDCMPILFVCMYCSFVSFIFIPVSRISWYCTYVHKQWPCNVHGTSDMSLVVHMSWQQSSQQSQSAIMGDTWTRTTHGIVIVRLSAGMTTITL